MKIEFRFQSRTWLNFLFLMVVAIGVMLWLMNEAARTAVEAVNDSRMTGLGALRREIEGSDERQ